MGHEANKEMLVRPSFIGEMPSVGRNHKMSVQWMRESSEDTPARLHLGARAHLGRLLSAVTPAARGKEAQNSLGPHLRGTQVTAAEGHAGRGKKEGPASTKA